MMARPSTSPASSSASVAGRSSSGRSTLIGHDIEVESAGERMVDQQGDVGGEPVRPHQRLLDVLAHEQVGAGERELVGEVGDADDGEGAAETHHGQALLHGLGAADRFEHVVGAASGERLDGRDRVVATGVDDVGRSAPARKLELRVVDVDGDDLLRVREPRTLDGGETHAAAPDDGDGRAGRNLRSVEDCTDTGEDTTPEQTRARQRERRVDLHDVVLAHEHVLGEAAQRDELVDGPAVVEEARRCVGTSGRSRR